MSREYLFYPAFREENGIIKPILYDVNKEPTQVFWRSGSFIDEDYFRDSLEMLDIDEMDGSFRKHFGEEDMFKGLDGKPLTYVYELTISELNANVSSGGMVQGYAPVNNMREYYAETYNEEYFHHVLKYNIIPPELYAELSESKKDEYVKFCTIDYYGKEYICSHLLEVLNDLHIPFHWKGERCYLMKYSF